MYKTKSYIPLPLYNSLTTTTTTADWLFVYCFRKKKFVTFSIRISKFWIYVRMQLAIMFKELNCKIISPMHTEPYISIRCYCLYHRHLQLHSLIPFNNFYFNFAASLFSEYRKNCFFLLCKFLNIDFIVHLIHCVCMYMFTCSYM